MSVLALSSAFLLLRRRRQVYTREQAEAEFGSLDNFEDEALAAAGEALAAAGNDDKPAAAAAGGGCGGGGGKAKTGGKGGAKPSADPRIFELTRFFWHLEYDESTIIHFRCA